MISLAILTISFICSARGHGGEIQRVVHSTVLDPEGKFHLAWNFNTSHIMFEIEVKTRGWVGLGFSKNGGMTGADIVMGWVDDNLGKTHFQDRHAVSKSTPMMDKHQNYTLLNSTQNATFTVFRFIRPLDLCGPEDFKITEDTIRVIWAYNDEDPSENMPPNYHGQHRGVKSIVLLNPMKYTPQMPDETLTFDFVQNAVTIPDDKDTIYFCRSFEIPKFSKKHHLIKVEPIIHHGLESEVHHIVMYACQYKNISAVNVSHECYHPNMPPEWSTCTDSFMAWAIGGGDFYFPDNVGYPFGGNDPEMPTMFLLETHYDNPQLKSGMVDSSGLRLTLTPQLRDNDAGMITMGVTTWEGQLIPPYYKDFLSQGVCSAECLAQAMGNRTNGINVFAVMLHSHTAGRKLRLRHIRDATELEPLMEDNNYDFNLQEMRLLPYEKTIRKGDYTLMDCHYNTEDRTTLTFGGLGTNDEMCLGFTMYYPKIRLSLCSSTPIPQKHVGFAGGVVDQQNKMLYPEDYKGEDWKTFVAQEVDWTSESERKRFKDYSLVMNDNTNFQMCMAQAFRYPANFQLVSVPKIVNPWMWFDKCKFASGAKQQQLHSLVLSVTAAITLFVAFQMRF